jgi:hypothetical protein
MNGHSAAPHQPLVCWGVEGGEDQGQRNVDVHRQGMRDAAAGTNFGRPSRRYSTAEEQAPHEMGFYKGLVTIEEDDG